MWALGHQQTIRKAPYLTGGWRGGRDAAAAVTWTAGEALGVAPGLLGVPPAPGRHAAIATIWVAWLSAMPAHPDGFGPLGTMKGSRGMLLPPVTSALGHSKWTKWQGGCAVPPDGPGMAELAMAWIAATAGGTCGATANQAGSGATPSSNRSTMSQGGREELPSNGSAPLSGQVVAEISAVAVLVTAWIAPGGLHAVRDNAWESRGYRRPQACPRRITRNGQHCWEVVRRR